METLPEMWSRLLGQDVAVAALRSAVRSGRRAHAYLFAGPQGVGRTPAALALAASVNCPDGGCGTCAVCVKVLRRAHADVHFVVAEGGQIVVDQVRAIREDAARAPFEGRTKVFILDEAERLNTAAANALLKVLEEPTGDTLFVLMTDAPDDLLPTVVSRCRRIDFAPLGPDDVVEILVAQRRVAPERARWAAAAGGNLATALRLALDEAAEERRERHLGFPARLSGGRVSAAIVLSEEIRHEADAAVAALKDRQTTEIADHAEAFGEGRGTGAARKRLETRHKREAKRVEQQTYEIVCADLAAFYRGAIARAGGPGDGVDAQVVRALDAVPLRPSVPEALAALDRIELARRAIARNAQSSLAVEALFMALGAAGVRGAA